jgi:ABC-type long-subunit fatty acid transport system fused permease/ATPase subunit
MTLDKKMLDKVYCTVEANKTAEYYNHITYDYVVSRIAEDYPQHIGDFLYAEIEFNKAETDRIHINKILSRVMSMYGIELRTLIADHKLLAHDSYDNVTVADMDSDRVEIMIEPTVTLQDIDDLE